MLKRKIMTVLPLNIKRYLMPKLIAKNLTLNTKRLEDNNDETNDRVVVMIIKQVL